METKLSIRILSLLASSYIIGQTASFFGFSVSWDPTILFLFVILSIVFIFAIISVIYSGRQIASLNVIPEVSLVIEYTRRRFITLFGIDVIVFAFAFLVPVTSLSATIFFALSILYFIWNGVTVNTLVDNVIERVELEKTYK